jgi:hypothetical protein
VRPACLGKHTLIVTQAATESHCGDYGLRTIRTPIVRVRRQSHSLLTMARPVGLRTAGTRLIHRSAAWSLSRKLRHRIRFNQQQGNNRYISYSEKPLDHRDSVNLCQRVTLP